MAKNVGFSEEQQPELAVPAASPSAPFRWLEKSELQAISRKADAWLEANRDLVQALPTGTYVLIDVDTGGHVTGADREAARAEFEKRFDASTISFVHRVRMPYHVGGGLWALRSGA